MNKPDNPYRKGTIAWSVMEGDWEDLTPAQIAEVLDVCPKSIRSAIVRIKRDTKYIVPCADGRKVKNWDEGSSF